MEQERYEEKKESASEDADSTPTPAKITEPPRNKSQQTVLLSISEVEEIQVPDKYTPLAEFYDAVQTSLRLLSLTNAIVKILTQSCEIPEAMLPEPFCRSNHIVLPKISSVNSSIESHIECEPSLAAFSCGQTMKKHLSQKIVVPETEKTELLASLVPPVYDSKETDLIAKNSPWKECSLASDSAITASPAALIFSPHCSNFSGSGSPVKRNSLLDPVTLQTPGQPTSAKRPLEPSTCKKSNNETKILSHTAAKRSLTFEGKEYMDDSLQPEVTKNIATDDYITAFRFTQVVDGYKNQTMNTGKRQEMIASLTDLINMIQRIFK